MQTTSLPPRATEDQFAAVLDELKTHGIALEKLGGAKGKDGWDKLSVVATLISSVVIATVGLIFNSSYQAKEEANRLALQEREQKNRDFQQQQESRKEEHERRMRELQLVAQVYPALFSPDENIRNKTYLMINAVGNTDLMAKLALNDGGLGATTALKAVVASPETTATDRATAARALAGNAREGIEGFMQVFGAKAKAAVEGTPFTPELLAAIAAQETGFMWQPLAGKGLTTSDILRLCVGDTLDADRGRRVFPKDKSDLLAAPRGAEMFAIARQALVDMAEVTPGYSAAVKNPDKFCHGFGIFQVDLMSFQTNPDFFLQKKWHNFEDCAAQAVGELKKALIRQGWADKTTLTNEEMVFVAIAYNKGAANVSLGFKQGAQSGGRAYGENIWEFLRIAQSVNTPDLAPGSLRDAP